MGFENTGYAKVLFQQQIPAIIKELKRIADSLEKTIEQNKVTDILNGIDSTNIDFVEFNKKKYDGPF